MVRAQRRTDCCGCRRRVGRPRTVSGLSRVPRKFLSASPRSQSFGPEGLAGRRYTADAVVVGCELCSCHFWPCWPRDGCRDAPRATSLQNIVEDGLCDPLRLCAGRWSVPRLRYFLPRGSHLFPLYPDLRLAAGFRRVSAAWVSGPNDEGRRTLVPLLRGATTDLNTTLALAMCSVLSMQVYGARYLGILSMVLALWP